MAVKPWKRVSNGSSVFGEVGEKLLSTPRSQSQTLLFFLLFSSFVGLDRPHGCGGGEPGYWAPLEIRVQPSLHVRQRRPVAGEVDAIGLSLVFLQ